MIMLFQIKKTTGVIFFVCISSYLYSGINLEDGAQEFVLETKQIMMPEYPYAFNPSIIRWNDRFLMSFRVIPNPRRPYYSEIGLVFLDKNFLPISKPQLLVIRSKNSKVPSRAEDGSLIRIGERLYLIYDDNTEKYVSKGG